MNYYHLTHPDNLPSIISRGLMANENGDIFLFENKSIKYESVINTVADCIAANQVFLDEYAMIEIDPIGIEADLINDDVGESSAKCQWIAKQSVIDPKYLSYLGTFDTNYTPFLPPTQ